MKKLEINNLSIALKHKAIIDDFSFSFTQGIYAIVGANGSGKTTFLKEIFASSLIPNNSIKFDGKMQLIMNDFAGVNENMTVFEYLDALLSNEIVVSTEWFPLAENLVKEFGWTNEYFKSAISQLSGAQRKFIDFIIASISKPELILIDEPEAHFDENKLKTLTMLLKSFAKNAIVIVSTHSDHVLSISNVRMSLNDQHLKVFESSIEEQIKKRKVFDEKFEFPN